MKKIAKVCIPVFITIYALLYLIGAFIAYDFNPGNWDPFGRAMAGLLGTLVAAIISSILIEID